MQVTLNDLPHDVLVLICDCVNAEDFDAVLATCKKLHCAAQHRLSNHKRLKDSYKRCVVDASYHPADLLHAIWTEPQIPDYIQVLDYTCNDQFEGDDVLEQQTFKHVRQETLQRIEEFKDELLSANGDVIDNMDLFGNMNLFNKQLLELGDETMALALLLLLMPNLKILKLSRPRWDGWVIRGVVRQLRDRTLQSQQENNCFTRSLLRRLHTVELEMDSTGYHNYHLPFVAFSDIPSVKNLFGSHIDFTSYPSEPGIFDIDLHRSNLECVEMSNSSVDNQIGDRCIFMEWLRYLPAWSTLKYSNSGTKYAPSRLCDMLQQLPGHANLRELSLTSKEAGIDSVDGFRWLSSLKHLECDADMFLQTACLDNSKDGRVRMREMVKQYNADDGMRPAAADRYPRYIEGWKKIMPDIFRVLPRSLTSLTLYLGRLSNDDIEDLFRSFVETREWAASNLKVISIAGKTLSHALQERIRKVGIEVQQLDEWIPSHDSRWGARRSPEVG